MLGEQKLRKEDGKIKPWTLLAKYSLQKEEEIKKMDRYALARVGDILVCECVVCAACGG